MIDLEKERLAPVNAILVGKTDDRNIDDAAVVRELASLAETAGLTPVGTIVLRRYEPAPKYGMGIGKAEEIAAFAKERQASQVVFDFEISPTQQRNWDELTSMVCLDRQELIIRIFATRARTREAVLQVELARLEYSLPRLAHTYQALSRQRGGAHGNKGSGETQLELDRRGVLDRINLIKKELIVVRRDRATQRKRREREAVASCAIVGYTNVGKSTLLNALTGAGVLSEDKLFATLDPTTRRFLLPTGRPVLLTDTVGFIRNLPHGLIDAFHATLEEAAFADVILLILDASDPEMLVQLETTRTVLSEVGAADQPELLVLNKLDRVGEFDRARLAADYPEAVMISARDQSGFVELATRLEALISGDAHVYHLPSARSDLLAFAHREGSVLSVEYEGEVMILRARTSGRLAAALAEFEVHA